MGRGGSKHKSVIKEILEYEMTDVFNLILINSQYACRGILWTLIWTLKSQVGKKHFALRYRPYWKEIPSV
ncbi:unnamed protein product [Rhizophagus irregularis]|nr:unnamed protein product [Rhizophagus irregularis]